MTREDFKKIIKLRSCWVIDRRRGDYELPNGKKLSTYVTTLVESQMELDSLCIRENGNLCSGSGGELEVGKGFSDYTLLPDFQQTETCTYEEQQNRIEDLVKELVG